MGARIAQFIIVVFCLGSAVLQAGQNSISQVPLSLAEAVEPNVMLLIDTSGSMRYTVPDDNPHTADKTRMQVAKEVARKLINDNPNVRFGLARFYGTYSTIWGHGATIDHGCSSNSSDVSSLKSTLATYTGVSNTPVAEALYEITRYFRGLKSYYHTGKRYISPVQYRCQKNFTIVVTDGLPTQDATFPTSATVEPELGPNQALPDWDGKHPATSFNYGHIYPPYSDGWQSGSYDHGQAKTLYLDDIAKFAWDLDLKKSGTDNAGGDYSTTAQRLYTYTVGFSLDAQMLKDAAKYGGGLYKTAANADELTNALNQVLADISDKSLSSSSVSASSGYVAEGLNLYQARYTSSTWAGNLVAYSVNTDPTNGHYGQVNPEPVWKAEEKILKSHGRRVVITNLGDDGKKFRWGKFSKSQKASYFNGKEQLFKYIRGNADSNYRIRTSLLGDIINSNPIYAGKPEMDITEGSYRSFKKQYANRDAVVYVGANDGMLHGFRAADGKELLAYIPGSVLPNLKQLASTDYTHQFYVDGTPTVSDAYVSNEWKTMLLGGLNAGGQGVYALNVTDPSLFTEANASNIFAWEFTDSDDSDMGYSFARPAIVKLKDGKWYAVFGNGYGNTEPDGHVSETGDAVVYIVDLATGALIKKISTDTGLDEAPESVTTPNGMSTLTPVSTKGNGVADYIYGGDLYGNVWKFDLTDDEPDLWKLDYKLFQACTGSPCSKDNVQPITSRVTVSRDPGATANLVLFGTGKGFELIDKTDARLNSFYGIQDAGDNVAGRDKLLQQTISKEFDYLFTNTKETLDQSDDETVSRTIRVTSDNRRSKHHQGWYLDLLSPNSGSQGERVLNRPVIRGKRIIFTTYTYSQDPCKSGGFGWLMELDKRTGSRFSYITIDLNRDGRFDSADRVIDSDDQSTVPSGIQMDNGNMPGFGAGEKDEFKFFSDNEGVRGERESYDPGSVGRQRWRYFPGNKK